MNFENVKRLSNIHPSCPEYKDPRTIQEMMPYFESIARRPYHEPDPGLHASWNLKKSDVVLVRPDNWYEKLIIDGTKEILERYGCQYDIEMTDRGPLPTLTGKMKSHSS